MTFAVYVSLVDSLPDAEEFENRSVLFYTTVEMACPPSEGWTLNLGDTSRQVRLKVKRQPTWNERNNEGMEEYGIECLPQYDNHEEGLRLLGIFESDPRWTLVK